MLKIDIVNLPTGGMHVIEGNQPFKGIDDCVVTSVARDLRLVVSDQPNLGHFGYVLRLQERPVQWNGLTKSPLITPGCPGGQLRR